MPTCIALLRAVNVGGTGKLPMADFRAILEKLGYKRIETYIQSGNAVFETTAKSEKVASDITKSLEKHLGTPVGVIVRTTDQLKRLIDSNPYATEATANGALVHAAFLAGPAGKDAEAALAAIVAKYPTRRDRYVLASDAVYFHFPDGAGETKFTGKTLDKAIGVIGTGRNWNTILKLYEMAQNRDQERLD
jgi:uncharacterized protein (DUF1697 family)